MPSGIYNRKPPTEKRKKQMRLAGKLLSLNFGKKVVSIILTDEEEDKNGRH